MFVCARIYFQFKEWRASAKKLVTKDFYGKVIECSEEKGLTHRVRFTSVSLGLVQGKPAYCLGGLRHQGGVNLNRALVGNGGACRPDFKDETHVEDLQG